jgi:hypothetical protein
MAKPRRRSQIAGMVSPAYDVIGALNPLITAYDGGQHDTTIGREIDTEAHYDLNPDKLMADGRIGSKKLAIFGLIGSGKTLLAKMMAYRLAGNSSGGRRGRIEADDINRRNGVPEYSILATELGCEPLWADEPLNEFDPEFKLSFSDHLDSARELFIQSNEGLAPVNNQEYILEVILSKMYREMPEIASLDTLEFLSGRPTAEDFTTYRALNESSFRGRVNLDENSEVAQRVAGLMDRKPTLFMDDLLRDAAYVNQRLNRLLFGNFGTRFGGTANSAQKLQQQVVIRDYTGLNDATVNLVQSFMWRLKRRSIANNDRRFMAQISLHDENYKLFRVSPAYAVNMSDDMKQQRNSDEFKVTITHRIRDYWSAGAAGSQAQNLATNMFSDFDMFAIGAQKKKDVRDLRKIMDISDEEERRIRAQRTGQFAIKIGQEGMVFIDTTPAITPTIARIGRSNGALDAALERRKIVDEGFVTVPPRKVKHAS